MTVLKDILSEAKNLAAVFEKSGAEVVEPDFCRFQMFYLICMGKIFAAELLQLMILSMEK